MSGSIPKIGVAWGSGAARGWAHVGVLRAFDEMGLKIDVEAGCSVGALVSGARRLGIWREFLAWAEEISPLDALGQFALSLGAGGLINPSRAFDAFRYADKDIQDLDAPWGAVATDLATGQEVWLTSGSVLDAARASSAIPMVMQSAPITFQGSERWMIDGAASNPVPVSLARALGAQRVIAVDLTASAVTLKRFARPSTREVVMVEATPEPSGESFVPDVVRKLISDTKDYLGRELTMAKAKAQSKPHFFETAAATTDIVQSHLAQARAQIDVADIRITPRLDDMSPAAFDQADEIIERGYTAAMEHKDQLLALRKEQSLLAAPPGGQDHAQPV